MSDDRFGSSVALVGERALVGTYQGGDPYGSAYLFEYADSAWVQRAKLVADDGDSGDGFGAEVALAGERALVGASADEDPNGESAGSAYLFERDDDGWTQAGKLAADDGDSDDNFGVALALDGERALLGAWDDEDPNGDGAGSAYVFHLDGGVSTPTPTPTATPTPTETATPSPTPTATEMPAPTPTEADTPTATTAEDGPGFGVLAALSGVGGWLWWRRR
ncbi:hypothetical protein BRC64_10535 [Halobacteriales archaeon QH_10_67_22]|nr:MAG: hypothetical protein BRC64_10535 [Halobacteriales archaeon QH_10_67_22]